MQRHLAELLVDGGFVSRRQVEGALRRARQGDEALAELLIREGLINAHEVAAVRRLQTLLVSQQAAVRLAADDEDDVPTHLLQSRQISPREYQALARRHPRSRQALARELQRRTRLAPERIAACLAIPEHPDPKVRAAAGLRLGDLLLSSGEINRNQLQRALALQAQSGKPLGEILIGQGWLRPRQLQRERRLQRRLATAAFGAAMAFSTMALLHKLPARAASSQPAPPLAADSPADWSAGADLRFASLGNIAEQLEKLRPFNRRAKDIPARFRTPARRLRPLVRQYAAEYSLPPEILYAMIETESSFNVRARSGKNAVGLMQLVPHEGGRAAYRMAHGRHGTPTVEELLEPDTNIRLGAAYLRLLLDDYFADVPDEQVRLAAALAAYNWGPTRLRSVLRAEGMPQSVPALQKILARHAPGETQRYLQAVTRRMLAYDPIV